MTAIQSRGNEELRQAYLRELGVQLYFPRRVLPGAKASAVYATVFLKNDMAVLSAGTGTQGAPSQQSLAQSVIEQLKPRDQMPQSEPAAPIRTVLVESAASPPAEVDPDPKDVAAVPIAAEDVKFAFAYFPVNEELAVINELPWARSAAVAPSTRQLLASILKALGVACEEKDLSSMVFSWPMPDMPLEEQGAESARQTLEGFLGRRFKLLPVRHLLVLAEQSAGFLFPPEFSPANEDPLFRHPHFDVSVTLTRSLNAMEAVPEIKRLVWQTLQPLKTALETGSAPQPSHNSSQDHS